MLHSICQQIWKTQQWPQDWKRSVFISIPKKGNAKECSNYRTIALISCASKVMHKILQTRLQKNVSQELLDVQAGFRKGRGTRDQIANICLIIEKVREFQKKTSTSASLTTIKPLIVWITTNIGKFLKRREYQTTLPVSWKRCMQVKNQQLELDIAQWLGKEYVRAVYCLFNLEAEYIMQNGRLMKHKLELRFQGEISVTSDMQITPPYGWKLRGTKEPLDESERRMKSLLKVNIQKTMAKKGGRSRKSDRFYFLGLQNHREQWIAMKLKDACSLEGKLWQI